MAQKLDNLAELQRYALGVRSRANHHAPNVEDVVDRLLAQVILQHDPGSVECRTYNGNPTNILRFAVRKHAVTLKYNHNTGEIDLREGNERGKVLASFSNGDSRQRIEHEFNNL